MAKYDKEKNLVSTEFLADEKKRAEGLNGPQEILDTFIEILKMFNPDAIHNDGITKGGITGDNIREKSITEKCLSDEIKKMNFHNNKLLLDGITADDKENFEKNTDARHIHKNKEILDVITKEMVSNLNKYAVTLTVSCTSDDFLNNKTFTNVSADKTKDEILSAIADNKKLFFRINYIITDAENTVTWLSCCEDYSFKYDALSYLLDFNTTIYIANEVARRVNVEAATNDAMEDFDWTLIVENVSPKISVYANLTPGTFYHKGDLLVTIDDTWEGLIAWRFKQDFYYESDKSFEPFGNNIFSELIETLGFSVADYANCARNDEKGNEIYETYVRHPHITSYENYDTNLECRIIPEYYKEYISKPLTSLKLTVDSSGGGEFKSSASITFISGEPATTFIAERETSAIIQDKNVYFSGVDCVDGIFTPTENKTYNITIRQVAKELWGEVKTRSYCLEEYTSGYLSVKAFGAVGDGVTDDTQAFKKICEYVNNKGYGKIVFEKGTYRVSIEDRNDYNFGNIPKIFEFNNCNVDIDLSGSTIVIDTNKSPFYEIFNFKNCNFKISNGILKGDRLNHDYNSYTTNTTHEFGFCIKNNGSIGYVANIEISDFTGDGIMSHNHVSWNTTTSSYIVLHRAFINIDNCNIHHCRRTGIVIGESNGTIIKNTKVHHIGTFDNIDGASPMSGINFEFEFGESYCDKCILDNIHIHDCSRFSLVNSNTLLNNVLNTLIIKNSILDYQMSVINSTNFIIENSFIIAPVSAYNCKFFNCNILIDERQFLANGCVFNNCYIEGKYNESKGRGSGIISDNIEKGLLFNDCTIKNITGNSNVMSLETFFQTGFDKWYQDYELTFNNCKIINCTSAINYSGKKPTNFNNCIVMETLICNYTYDETVFFKDCEIKNIYGGVEEARPIVFNNCIIEDVSNKKYSFVGVFKAKIFNSKLKIINDNTSEINYNIECYNSFLDFQTPLSVTFKKAKLYNCFLTCNTPEENFKGIKENTSYIVKE